MKKFSLAALVALLVACPVGSYAQSEDMEETPAVSLELYDYGIATSYNWRGQELGGLNAQADLSLNFTKNDFNAGIGTWFVHAFQESIYGPFMGNGYQEWDTYAYVGYGGLTLTATDYMSAPYFNKDLKIGHAFDGTLEYYFGDEFPLTLAWSTIFAGEDYEEDAFSSINHRFYSSYFEAGYDFSFGDLPIDFNANVGFVPWTSPYIDDAEGAHFAYLGLGASYGIEFKNGYELPVSANIGLNPTDGHFLWSVSIGF